MTIHEALLSFIRQPLLGAWLLILVLEMILLLSSFRDGRNWMVRLLYLVWFFGCFACLFLSLWDIALDINPQSDSEPVSRVLQTFRTLPVSAMVLYEGIHVLMLSGGFFDRIRYRKSHPTRGSIKETMDLLPVGIAFGKADGTVVFTNLAMNELSCALTGKALRDMDVFREAAVQTVENEVFFNLPGGKGTWQLSREELDVDGAPYIRLTAMDVTEQTAITRELHEKNEKLRGIHMRLDHYHREAARIVIAQELLTARMTVHSEVGNVLLESRRYLEDPASYNEGVLLQALKNTNTYLLREYEEDDSVRDVLRDALRKAEAVGVDVAITGVIPQEDSCRTVLAAAISECASNTVKHAKGDRVDAEICDTGKEMVLSLQNNGEAPKGTVHETGGLCSLRSLVEKENGTMRISSAPAFRLSIRIPKARRPGSFEKDSP